MQLKTPIISAVLLISDHLERRPSLLDWEMLKSLATSRLPLLSVPIWNSYKQRRSSVYFNHSNMFLTCPPTSDDVHL